MKPLRCVVAMDVNRGIGKDNELPWKLRKEFKYFTKLTSDVSKEGLQNVVIMGRKTWESIPAKFKPLPKRINLVLSRTLSDVPEGVILKPNLTEAIKAVNESPLIDQIDNVYVIGGAGVYKETIESEHCDRIYLSHVMKAFDCDTFFPEFDESVYQRTSNPHVTEEAQEENDVKYELRMYERKK